MNGAAKMIGSQLRRHPEQLLLADKLPSDISIFLKGQHVYLVVR